MATVKKLLTNLGDNTRKFLGTSDTLSLEEMAVGIGKASDESDFQTELIEEFSNILDRSAAPDSYANGKEDGYADALDKRTNLVVTENGDYAPTDGSTGFKSVSVNVVSKASAKFVERTVTELTAEDFEGITKIGNKVFSEWATLKSVVLSDTVTEIGDYAFKGAVESIDLAKVTKIGKEAFYFSYLKTLRIPNTVTSLGSGCFKNMSNLESVIFDEERTKNISLSDTCFYYAPKLKNLTLPKRLYDIGMGALMSTGLETLVLPSTTWRIQEQALEGNKSLHTITVKATTPPILASDSLKGCTALTKIIVPIGCKAAYSSATNWATYADKIVEGDV